MTDNELEGAPVREGLEIAARSGWSGLLRVVSGCEHVGVVVMREGRIAWAVCRYQREDLGSLLQRRGHITAAQLAEVTRRYEALGKTKKLAALLEEAGIVDPETLRSCLATHVRRAIASLLQDPVFTVQAQGGEFVVGEETTFAIGDVLPEDADEAVITDLGLGGGALEAVVAEKLAVQIGAVLTDLSHVPGHRATVIARADGRLLASRGLDESGQDAELLTRLPVGWLRAASRTAADAGLGDVDIVLLECASGSLLARWVRAEAGVFLALLLDKDGRVGVAKHKILAAGPAIAGFVVQELTRA